MSGWSIRFQQQMLLHNRKILAAVVLVNLGFAAVILTWQKPALSEGLEPLQLVTEKSIALVSEAPAVELIATEEPEEPEQVCRIWGPVASPEEFESIADKLEMPQVFTEEVGIEPKFMVLIPALDRAEAARISQELGNASVDNYATVRDGRRVVSVGIFSSLDRANLYQGKIRGMGYEVETEIISRTREMYNLRGFTFESSPEFASSNSSCPAIADS